MGLWPTFSLSSWPFVVSCPTYPPLYDVLHLKPNMDHIFFFPSRRLYSFIHVIVRYSPYPAENKRLLKIKNNSFQQEPIVQQKYTHSAELRTVTEDRERDHSRRKIADKRDNHVAFYRTCFSTDQAGNNEHEKIGTAVGGWCSSSSIS